MVDSEVSTHRHRGRPNGDVGPEGGRGDLPGEERVGPPKGIATAQHTLSPNGRPRPDPAGRQIPQRPLQAAFGRRSGNRGGVPKTPLGTFGARPLTKPGTIRWGGPVGCAEAGNGRARCAENEPRAVGSRGPRTIVSGDAAARSR